jgi:lipopolysaccharide export system protein LptA
MKHLIPLTLALVTILPTSGYAQNKSDSPIEISADDSLEWHREKNQYTAIGNAVAIQDDKTIKADTLTAYYTQSETNDTQITRITAKGNVVITTATDTAYGDNGEYDVTTELVTLNGKVRVEREKNVLNGDKATVNLKTGISKMLSAKKGQRVTGTFFPKSK